MTLVPRLRIDARAEASLRAGGELEGPWQIPSELARRAFRAGARRVWVTCRRDGFVVRDDGAALDAGTRALLQRALDARSHGREEALERLESGDQAELRFLATLPRALVALTSGSAVSVSGLRWDVDVARQWLRSVGRFAGAAIDLDGEPLPEPAAGPLGQAAITALPGRLWLRADGEDGAIWVLRDRVVAAFLVVPGSLPFEAVLDLSATGARTAADLRERVAPLVPSLADDAARLVCDAAGRPDALAPPADRRLRALVLEAARLPRWRGPALRAAVFPARQRERSLRLSLADLGSAAAGGEDRRIPTCEPRDAARALFLSDAPVVLLEGAERARLSQELGLRFALVPFAEGPAPRPWPGSLWRRLAGSRRPGSRRAGDRLFRQRRSRVRDEAPKSAYELAMERLRKKDREEGVEEKPLTDAQKAEIAEARRVAEAQMAEKEIFHRSALARAADPESAAALEDDYRRERERIASRRDEAIAAIRARG